MPLEPGNLLQNRYRILEVLGHGGMGSVYHAVDEVLQVEVAIKENLFASSEYAEQFRQEARLLATLRHPNLPRVTDYFVLEGQGQYLIMDYIPGVDLKDRIDREGALPLHEVLTIAMALCEALEYLHTQQPPIIHRDIKPANVRITPQGQVYLVDFGLAKLGGADQRTLTGAQAVTPGFSSPEQYGTSGHTDPRSDLYSLAATLYMALTGVAPEDAFERLMGTHTLTPIRELRHEVPPQLAAIVEQALALQREERQPSVRVFKEQLLALNLLPNQETLAQEHRWVLQQSPTAQWRTTVEESPFDTNIAPPGDETPTPPALHAQPSTQPRKTKRRRKGRLAFSGFLLLIALLILAMGALAHPVLRAQLNQALPALGTVEALPQAQAPLATAQMWLYGIPWQPTTTPLPASPTTASAAPPSPTLALVLRATASPTSTATASPTSTPTSTSTPTLPPSPTPSATSALVAQITLTPVPQPTPFGRSGAIAFASTRSGLAQIWLYDISDQSFRPLTNEPDGACQPTWAPDGQRLAFITPCTRNQVRYDNARIMLLDLRTGTVQVLVPPSQGDYDPAWSPDGNFLAFTSLRDGHPQIYLYNLQTQTLTNLSQNEYDDFMPAWSPDGTQLAFISTRQGVYRIYLMPPSGQPQQGFSHSSNKRNLHPIWSPDGVYLLYSQTPAQGIPMLVSAPVADRGLVEHPLNPALGIAMADPAYSPDGRWLAVEGWRGAEAHDLYLISSNGQTLRQITNDEALDFDPAWRPLPAAPVTAPPTATLPPTLTPTPKGP